MQTTVTLDEQILAWVLERTGPAKQFHNLSHAVDTALYNLRNQDDSAKREAELTIRLRESDARLTELRRLVNGNAPAATPRRLGASPQQDHALTGSP